MNFYSVCRMEFGGYRLWIRVGAFDGTWIGQVKSGGAGVPLQ